MNVDGITGQADDALDVVRCIGRERWLEDDDLLAVRIAPERHVPAGKGDAGVVADTAHDEVIADQQGIFHGARGNDAGLADGPVDEHEGERHPEPSDDFTLDALAHR